MSKARHYHYFMQWGIDLPPFQHKQPPLQNCNSPVVKSFDCPFLILEFSIPHPAVRKNLKIPSTADSVLTSCESQAKSDEKKPYIYYNTQRQGCNYSVIIKTHTS